MTHMVRTGAGNLGVTMWRDRREQVIEDKWSRPLREWTTSELNAEIEALRSRRAANV